MTFLKKLKKEWADKSNSTWDVVQYMYWHTWPYDWRPGQLWYRLKCLVWHRYTTVKSRHLGHTWCDKTDLLPYTMFELLEDFVESECSPGIVDWDSDDDHRNARKEMDDLLDWWNNRWLKKDELEEPHWKKIKEIGCEMKFTPIEGTNLSEWGRTGTKEQQEAESKEFAAMRDIEAQLDKELEDAMIRLVKLRHYLWT